MILFTRASPIPVPWTFEARTVAIDFQEGEQAIVGSGLKAGERVVVKGGVLLND